jgi:putative aminopeptidase FrvX
MKSKLNINTEYLLDVLTQLVNTPSPVGDTERGIELCRELICKFDGLDVQVTRKGALVAHWPGKSESAPRGVTAHVDTLGAVVREIKPNGRMKLSQLGNFPWTSVENEGVTLQAFSGPQYRGSIVVSNASHHVHPNGVNVQDLPHDDESMELRIDARTTSVEDTRALGIEVGDYVYFDPRLEVNNGFVRTRHIDDKGCIACVLAAMKAIYDSSQMPAQRTTIHIANYEEVGHGGSSGFPDDLAEVLAIDIGPIGVGQNSDEYSCSLCVRDEDGPYDIKMGRKLRHLAQQHDIALKIDTYPKYCSDGDALWKAGADVRCALIGPGVDATHGYERTHMDALVATAQLIATYLLEEE